MTDLVAQINEKLDLYRKKADDAEAEVKRFGQESADTKSAMEAMKGDLVLLQGQLADFKRAQVLQGGAGQQSQEDAEVKSVFDRILRKSNPRFTDAEQKALSTITNPDGGYLVPRDTSGRIITKIQDFSPMRRYASVQAISTDALEGLLAARAELEIVSDLFPIRIKGLRDVVRDLQHLGICFHFSGHLRLPFSPGG